MQAKRPPAKRADRSLLQHISRPPAMLRYTESVHATAGATAHRKGVLFATRAENERRVIFPVIGGPGVRTNVPGLDGRATRTALRNAAATLDWVDENLARIDRHDLRNPWRAAAILTEQHRLMYARMDFSRYRCVLVPRQSHPFVRALIQAAQAQSVPVAYLPHSPLTRWQIDLPVTHAGLRGNAERTYVAQATGADPNRIAVVGNPGSDVLGAHIPQLDRNMPGVFALGPGSERNLDCVVDLLRAAEVGSMIVAPHPRSERRALQLMRRNGWSVYEGHRTTDLLRLGVPWVLQSDSGVAWEAGGLGIPTANILLGSTPSIYPFLDAPEVVTITSPADLRSFVTEAAGTDRQALRGAMREWCSYDGTRAVERGSRFLDAASEDGHASPIADAWESNGSLWKCSALTAL